MSIFALSTLGSCAGIIKLHVNIFRFSEEKGLYRLDLSLEDAEKINDFSGEIYLMSRRCDDKGCYDRMVGGFPNYVKIYKGRKGGEASVYSDIETTFIQNPKCVWLDGAPYFTPFDITSNVICRQAV